MVVNTDPVRAMKTMIKILFFTNLIVFICTFFFNVSIRGAILANVVLLGIQYVMNSMESRVQPLIEKNKYASKVNDFAGRING
jgi:hypothetical protein